jgi:hypothetical protein
MPRVAPRRLADVGRGNNLAAMTRGQNIGYEADMLLVPEAGDAIVLVTASESGTTPETALNRFGGGQDNDEGFRQYVAESIRITNNIPAVQLMQKACLKLYRE